MLKCAYFEYLENSSAKRFLCVRNRLFGNSAIRKWAKLCCFYTLLCELLFLQLSKEWGRYCVYFIQSNCRPFHSVAFDKVTV